jgi:NADH-quinone oxidoreductase subunit F
VAVGEEPEKETTASLGITLGSGGTVTVDPDTLCTTRQGVFAGGDVVTGPKTAVDAIAAGKKAAVIIDRYLAGEALTHPVRFDCRSLCRAITMSSAELAPSRRVSPPELPVESRVQGFTEVEMSLTPEQAVQEAKRCLRCDLDFTRPKEEQKEDLLSAGKARA